MSILVDRNTKLVIQGMGSAGRFHANQMREYGTQVVAAVRPGKGGQKIEGFPVFDSVAEAVETTGADASAIYVPAGGCLDAILEAADAGIGLCIVITEGIAAADMVKAFQALRRRGSEMRIIGPNCPGIITPGECKIGIMPGYIHQPGRVGVISRSGTLTYEAVWQLSERGIGQSTCIGIGGDQLIGTTHIDALRLFQDDPDTDAVIMIGEIGGTAEEEAAEFIQSNVTKPLAAFIAGQTAPPGKRMGHAGAIISGGSGKAADKIAALEKAGVAVAKSPADLGVTLAEAAGL
ncbi:MAG: succinate--CoA ligase subunit alpha [Deltaproteobacteria bacterium]|nr:succinate--CoA ligase subunit alpha [Deltaproteobacteria bacterium]